MRSVPASAGFLAVALVLALAARLPLRDVVRATRGVLLLAGAAAAFQWWVAGSARPSRRAWTSWR